MVQKNEGCNSGDIAIDTPTGKQNICDGCILWKSGGASWYCDGAHEGSVDGAGNCVQRRGSGRRRFQLQSATCVVPTQAPTKAPTNNPTQMPTKVPAIMPSTAEANMPEV